MNTQAMTMENAPEWHVCSLIVQCNPSKIDAVKMALLAIPNTEIPVMEEEKGKLVVVMQSHHQRDLLDNMEGARDIDGVMAVSLIYHEQDESPVK